MNPLHVAYPVELAPDSSRASNNDPSDIDLLHRISVELIGEQDREALYGKIVDAAVSITGSQFGTMQLLCPHGHSSGHGGELQLLCSRGLSAEAVGFWQWVNPAAYSSCTLALKLGRRAIIADFEQWDDIAGTPDLLAFRSAGIRSAQTTPLMSRNGHLLGMISTHWREPHQPSERDLRLLDILARQAADLLERTMAEEALRAREQELARTCSALREIEERQRQTEAKLLRLNETLEQRVAERTTRLMQAEEKLRQSQKMEAVGQLTGGLAHDFNNLLASISGSLELMSRRITQGRWSEIHKYMAAAEGAAKRAATLTHRLLAFSRRQTLEPRPTNANTLIYGMTELIQRTVGPGIQVETLGSADQWPVLVDASQLENTLLNLCINARDAMPDGGRITLQTTNQCLDLEQARVCDLAEGQYLCLSVTDTGMGMSPEVMAHVFEPFFTTKPIGQGTGLGLSMIYGFAQQSGGQVRIDSKVGEGTTVSIYLPRHNGVIPQDEPTPGKAAVAVEQHGETVLLVDDEPTVRMLMADVLGELGYTVIEAGDSTAGLKLLRSDIHIDVLVTDVGLPGGMNGRQMADAGMELRPDLKTLFITGYAESAAIGKGQLKSGMHVLTKPFAVETLGTRVRELLVK
ncbi:GAF domain-containing hybrid sensor histidine kinase/response regulator [Pseudomonas vancouverensis]|uniref:histidine kinase n=1 Tax=Pseudomonas vancouverensis TaxID=95300 RepID=A0A1H2NS74_PSEVA|nr:ATP-binding protein [Pseudomonas vancouverensis]KAB0491126.1 response regulator [Pseudomonas vancouverensis]TDB59662.1 response regulator [Pseudomonas vancouverensis]SDV08329.1 His Kinase A (phospho-acceptor) domain-containing protein [Pseudomonas vancouverensis]